MWDKATGQVGVPDPLQDLKSEILYLKEMHEDFRSDSSQNCLKAPTVAFDAKYSESFHKVKSDIFLIEQKNATLRIELSKMSEQLASALVKVDVISNFVSQSLSTQIFKEITSYAGEEHLKVGSAELGVEGKLCADSGGQNEITAEAGGVHNKGNEDRAHPKATNQHANEKTVPALYEAALSELQEAKKKKPFYSITREHFKPKFILGSVFGIRSPDHRLGIEGSELVHPSSMFHRGFDSILVLVLLYSAFIVPMQLSFWNSDADVCNPYPTMNFDMFVDLFFLIDAFYRFFVGQYALDGSYCDDLKEVATQYISSPSQFWFNLLTSIPLSWIDFIVVQECQKDDSQSQVSANIDYVRIVKPLRILKFLRLMKLSTLFKTLTAYLDNPLVAKLVKIVFMMLIVMHVSCCTFWAVKVQSNDNDEVEAFLESKDLTLESNVWQLYLLCIYAVVAVFTTVGFGDIVADNSPERVYFVFCMLLAGCLFGTWMAQTQQIITAWNSRERAADDKIQPAVDFMSDHRVPSHIRRRVRQWLRHKYNSDSSQETAVVDELPFFLRSSLNMFIYQNLFLKVPIISKIIDPTDRLRFVAAMLSHLNTFYFQKGDLVARRGTSVDKIMVIVHGRVAMYTSGSTEKVQDLAGSIKKEILQSTLQVLNRGNCIGENALLGDKRWAGAWGIDASFCAIENGFIVYVPLAVITDDILRDPRFASIAKMLFEIGKPISASTPGNEGGDTTKNDFYWIRFTKGLQDMAKQRHYLKAHQDFRRESQAKKRNSSEQNKSSSRKWISQSSAQPIRSSQPLFSLQNTSEGNGQVTPLATPTKRST